MRDVLPALLALACLAAGTLSASAAFVQIPPGAAGCRRGW